MKSFFALIIVVMLAGAGCKDFNTNTAVPQNKKLSTENNQTNTSPDKTASFVHTISSRVSTKMLSFDYPARLDPKKLDGHPFAGSYIDNGLDVKPFEKTYSVDDFKLNNSSDTRWILDPITIVDFAPLPHDDNDSQVIPLRVLFFDAPTEESIVHALPNILFEDKGNMFKIESRQIVHLPKLSGDVVKFTTSIPVLPYEAQAEKAGTKEPQRTKGELYLFSTSQDKVSSYTALYFDSSSSGNDFEKIRDTVITSLEVK